MDTVTIILRANIIEATEVHLDYATLPLCDG